MPELRVLSESAHIAAPVVLVVEPADRVVARRSALARIGVAAEFLTDGAALDARLARDWSVDVVLLDLALATPDLLHRLTGLGLANAGPSLIAFADADSADTAGVALAGRIVAFLEPGTDDTELAAALDVALRDSRSEVGEQRSRDLASIGALSREVERIATALAQMASSERDDREGRRTVTAARVRTLIRARRQRERYFPAELFSDPAWDMLLDLTAARLDGQMVSVSSLCIAAAVPTTTALRWIRNLCDAGLFERRVDPDDARRAFIVLGDTSYDAMMRYLAVVSFGPSVV